MRRGYLRAAVAGQGLVDLVDVGGHRLEAGVEAIETFLLDLLKGLLGLLGSLSRGLELCVVQKKETPCQAMCAAPRFIVSARPPPVISPSLVSWNLSLTLSSFSIAFMLGALIRCRMLCCSFRRCCSVLVSALISSSDSASWNRGQMSTLSL